MAVPAAVAAAAAAFRRGASRPTDSGTPAMRTRGKESPCPLLSLPEKKAPVLLCLAVVGRFRRGGGGGAVLEEHGRAGWRTQQHCVRMHQQGEQLLLLLISRFFGLAIPLFRRLLLPRIAGIGHVRARRVLV